MTKRVRKLKKEFKGVRQWEPFDIENFKLGLFAFSFLIEQDVNYYAKMAIKDELHEKEVVKHAQFVFKHLINECYKRTTELSDKEMNKLFDRCVKAVLIHQTPEEVLEPLKSE